MPLLLLLMEYYYPIYCNLKDLNTSTLISTCMLVLGLFRWTFHTVLSDCPAAVEVSVAGGVTEQLLQVNKLPQLDGVRRTRGSLLTQWSPAEAADRRSPERREERGMRDSEGARAFLLSFPAVWGAEPPVRPGYVSRCLEEEEEEEEEAGWQRGGEEAPCAPAASHRGHRHLETRSAARCGSDSPCELWRSRWMRRHGDTDETSRAASVRVDDSR